MRSPTPTPGRNRLLENIWQAITSFTRTLISGAQRPRSRQFYNVDPETLQSRGYDLEITEPIVRQDLQTRTLVEMVEYCPEVGTAIDIRNNAIWGSIDGDDQGWAIAQTLNDNVTPIEPEVYDILQRLQNEVIGGVALKIASQRFLSFGDAFMEVGINFKRNRIERILFLPTFEMFRVEDKYGQLLGFQQRASIADTSPIGFHPLSIVHWRFRRKNLYGRSLFHESIPDWLALQEGLIDLQQGSRSVGINPNLHLMPCNYTEENMEEYKRKHKERLRIKNITDFYLMNGAEIRKLSSTNPDLKGVLDNINFRRLRIGMKSEVPLYLLGIPWDGGKDIAMQPSLNFVRSVNADRMVLTEGIKYLCNLELALNGIEKKRWNYRIIWPKIYVNPYEQQMNPQADESNQAGIEDLDSRQLYRQLEAIQGQLSR